MEATKAAGFASIMTHFDLGPWAEARGRLAASLADEHGARFIGVAAELPITVVSDINFAVQEVADDERSRAHGDIAAAKKTFDTVVGSRNDVEWRCSLSDPTRFLIQQSRAADLIVVGRRASYDESDPSMSVWPGVVAMEAGRPLLVVPPEKDFLAGHKVVVAWKETREARRAVKDALPILKKANEVVVMTASAHYRDESAEDVCSWLSRHGVACRPSLHTGEMTSVAGEVLDLVSDIGADLIVSGAYGHSRMREWLFGGATRDLLETSGACLFMSH